jgi:hypothetical protein
LRKTPDGPCLSTTAPASAASGLPATPVCSTLKLAPLGSAPAELCSRDGRSKLLKMIGYFGRGFSGKEDHEFFSATAKSLTASRNPCQFPRDEPQNLVSGVVSVGVVEFLEVVDIDRRNRVRGLEPRHRVVEGAP